MQKETRYIVSDRYNPDDCKDFLKLGLSPIICSILKNRGISNKSEALRFLNPKLDMLHDPLLLPDMDEAVHSIKQFVDSHDRITIYGDYDADGITSTSVLYRCLKSIGANVDYYIPNRVDEGYGLNMDAVHSIIEKGCDLIITVDCGVTSIDEVKYCKDNGTEIIITDHHECKDVLPDTFVVNPKRKDSIYPFAGLAGVGVVFKLVMALSKFYKDIDPFKYIDLTAIGTIADIVPVIDENRVIIKYGLDAVKNTANLGIRALIKSVNLSLDDIDTESIGYIIAPRINAVGRVSSADTGVNLFITDDADEALHYAKVLCDSNRTRQEIEEAILIEAEEKLKSYDDFVIVLESKGWHIGVLGIVASRLVERYSKPTILLSSNENVCRGSGRSIAGFNLYEALTGCSDLLYKFGGHEQAAGLSLPIENIEAFRKRINEIAMSENRSANASKILNADCFIKPEEINLKLADEIKLLEPFGVGNTEPVFVLKSAKVKEVRTVGAKNNHLKLKLQGKDSVIDGIGFNMGPCAEECSNQKKMDVAFSIEKNKWHDTINVELIIKDMRPSIIEGIEREYCRGLKVLFENLCRDDGLDNDTLFGFDVADHDVNRIMEENSLKPSTAIFVSNSHDVETALEYKSLYETCIGYNSKRCGNPALIICPDIEKICFDGIREIYLLDSFVQYGMIKEVCQNHDILCHACIPSYEDVQFIDSIKPKREDMVKIYLHMRNEYIRGKNKWSLEKLSEETSIGLLRLYYIMKIFDELSIISCASLDDGDLLVKFNRTDKKDISDSPSMKMFEKLHNRLCFINKIFNDYMDKQIGGTTDEHKRKDQSN